MFTWRITAAATRTIVTQRSKGSQLIAAPAAALVAAPTALAAPIPAAVRRTGFLGPHALALGLLGESPGSHRNNTAANRLVEPVGTGATHAVCLLLLSRLLQLLQHVLDRGVHARPVARAAFFATRLSPAPVFRTALFADLMAFVVLDFLRLVFFMIPPVPGFVQLGSFLVRAKPPPKKQSPANGSSANDDAGAWSDEA